MPAPIGACNIEFKLVTGRLAGRPPTGLLHVLNVKLTGPRQAEGKAVIIDPAKVQLTLYCDESMLDYDFSRFAIVDPPPQQDLIYKPISSSSKPLRDLIDEKTIFACCGQTDGLWAPNSVVIVGGRVIKRSAPGVNAADFYPLNGSFPFFVFDRGKLGLANIDFRDHEPTTTFDFQNAISGPVLIKNRTRIDGKISFGQPNIQPNQLMWDAVKEQRALAAIGHNERGHLIFVALAGDPEAGTYCKAADVVDVLWRLKVVNAILLGASADVQQFVRLPDGQGALMVAQPRTGSSMAKMFPGGRPLSSAILVKAIV